jgi:curved DNA-binding protein CbpA
MQLKDYYKILETKPRATPTEIKKAFRRLALQYHPDRNIGNHLAEAQFKEIQEAYEVLSDPEKRKEYNYKRWHLRSLGKSYTEQPLTPTSILEECRALKTYIDSMSIFRIDYDAVSRHIRQLLSPTTIGILQQSGDKPANHEIIQTLLAAANPLPLRYFMPITDLLLQVDGSDPGINELVRGYVREKKMQAKWDIYKWIVMVIITILLLWLMIEFGRS